jgi:hypothetical protein
VRYQSTTGLDSDQIDELVGRIEEIECGRKSGHGRPVVVDLYGQVVIALVLLRQNLNQMAVADLFGLVVDVVAAGACRLSVVPAQQRAAARALPYGRRRFGCRH